MHGCALGLELVVEDKPTEFSCKHITFCTLTFTSNIYFMHTLYLKPHGHKLEIVIQASL